MLDRRVEPAVTAPILPGMPTQLDDALSTAALNETERRAVARIVDFLEEELGADLLAVWLYGSRARGEADPRETDPDRRSDVDMIAIVASGRDAGEAGWELRPRWEALVAAEGDSPPYYSLRFYDTDFLRERRAIRDFFFAEVDRDRLILHGDGLLDYGGAVEGDA
jgi:predicted nucleotidyltransferase